MVSSENTSLLSSGNSAGHDRLHDVYLRFSSTRKNIIVAVVSGCIVIHCMSILIWPDVSSFLCMNRFDDWDVYTFNTADCQGHGFNRGSCQVIHFPKTFLAKDDLFPVFSIAVSMTILASAFGVLAAASYSTFCKFLAVWVFRIVCHDWASYHFLL